MNTVIEVDTELKEQAEEILGKIGLSYVKAVDLFTRQIILRQALPVELNIQTQKPLCIDDLTDEVLDAMIKQSFDEFDAGLGIPAEEVERAVYERYGREI